MARMQMPPQNPRLNFVINDFSGGMVNNINDTKMRDNQSPDMLNMQFRIDGLIQKRPGTQFLEKCPLENKVLKAVYPYEYKPNLFTYVYHYEDGLYCYGTGGELYRVHTTYVEDIDYCTYMGRFYYVDGANVCYLDYENFEKHIIRNPPKDFVPEPKPTIVGVVKSTEKKPIDTIFGEASSIPWTWCATWYEPCQYEMEDGYKGANITPPNPTLINVKDDRLYVSGNSLDPNMIYISEILEPHYYPASLPIQTPPNDDYITTLELYNDSLIIGRRDSVYSLSGNTNRTDSISPYVLKQINTHTGIASSVCSDMVFSRMFYVGSDGNFYKLNPPNSNSSSISTTQVNTLIDLTLPPFNLTVGDIKMAHTYFDGTYGLWYIQIADITLVYNYQLQAWTRYDRVDALNFFSINEELRFTRKTGNIYRFASREGNQQYYDEYYDPEINKVIKLPVVAYWTSRNMDLGSPARVKQFRDTYVTSECFEDYQTTVNVRFEIDYVDINDSFVIKNEISKWDSALFDENKFVSRNIDRSLPMMLNRRGRTIKVYYGCGFEYWGAREELPVPGIIPEYQMVYLTSVNKLYVRVPRRDVDGDKYAKYYRPLRDDEMNQALLVHNVMGIYELKGYR